jgi:hypothetical protein
VLCNDGKFGVVYNKLVIGSLKMQSPTLLWRKIVNWSVVSVGRECREGMILGSWIYCIGLAYVLSRVKE